MGFGLCHKSTMGSPRQCIKCLFQIKTNINRYKAAVVRSMKFSKNVADLDRGLF